MTQPIAVYTTVGDEAVARTIADALVERRLAACVQIEPIESVYRWQGEVVREREFRLLAKTTDARYAEVERAIRELHPYELPAIHAVAFAHASADYAGWIEAAVDARE